MAGPGGTVPPKRKEIYKYEAPWTVFSMNWSVRPDKRFRLALGSFVEEYNNKLQVTMLTIKAFVLKERGPLPSQPRFIFIDSGACTSYAIV